MLTEKEAWEELAESFSKPIVEDGWWHAIFQGREVVGLCIALDRMFHSEHITMGIYEDMLKKIKADAFLRGTHNNLYFWRLTREGMIQRAEFCKTQAEKL